MAGGDGIAMSDITDFYQQQAANNVSDIPWLAQLQTNALANFECIGFPSRHDEDWKYTSVDGFLKQRFITAHAHTVENGSIEKEKLLPIPCNMLSIINGIVCGHEALLDSLPAGVLVLPLEQALKLHSEKVKPWLGKILKQEHAFHAINTAMLQCGVFIYLPAGVHLTTPLLLTHWQDQANQAAYIRHLIIAETGSSATIIQDYQGKTSTTYCTNTITEVHLAAHSALTHYVVQRESQAAFHTNHLAVNQTEGSQFDNHSFSVGGKMIRSDITINLNEPHARCFMNGIYAPTDGQHMDHHTRVNHAVPDCKSAQDYKGILSGQSRAVFNGVVMVAKDAQHTEAKQQNKNLLLSVNAEIDTKPQLEIFANDVVCTHGATVGQLDEEALFYLATRGIEKAQASQYLIQAFTADNLRAMPHADLANELNGLLNQQIG